MRKAPDAAEDDDPGDGSTANTDNSSEPGRRDPPEARRDDESIRGRLPRQQRLPGQRPGATSQGLRNQHAPTPSFVPLLI